MTSPLKNKAVLVTGAAGCIGAWAVKTLRDKGAIPVVYDLTENRARLDLIMEGSGDVNWETGDVSDYDRLSDVIAKHRVQAIIHLAALQVPFCKAKPVLSAQVNVVGTACIFEAARQHGISRLTYASSIAAPAMGENDWLATLYGAHKICGEQMAFVYWQDWQVPSICIRPGVIYGPGRDQGMSAAPSIAALAAFAGKPYHIPFSGPVAYVYVQDAAQRFVAAVEHAGDNAYVFDMQGTPADTGDILNIIKIYHPEAGLGISGGALPFPHAPDDGGLDKLLGVTPYRSLDTGIGDMLAVFRTAKARGVLTEKLTTELIEKNS